MSERPEQRPEGRLIGSALQRSKYSQRQAAPLAGMSEGHWRAVVKGYRTASAGVYAPVWAPPGTIARMARVVGVTPEQLEEAGRADAAEELRNLPPEKEPDLPTVPAELVEHVERRLTEEGERQDAKMAKITEALRSVLGDDATEKLLETLEDPPNGDRRRDAG